MSSSFFLDPSQLESQLRQKLAAVLAAPCQSAIRAKAMGDLLRIVMQLPGIKRVNHQDYALALNQTWEWMSRNIDEFRSSTNSLERDLVTWINGYLYWRVRDIYHSSDRRSPLSLDENVFENGETYLDLLSESGSIDLNLNNLSQHIQLLQQQDDRRIATQIEQWIQIDPERQLQDCSLRDRDYCNCQIISSRILINDPPDSLTAISTDLNIPYQTLVAHWKRRCLPLLQAKAKSLGYEPFRN